MYVGKEAYSGSRTHARVIADFLQGGWRRASENHPRFARRHLALGQAGDTDIKTSNLRSSRCEQIHLTRRARIWVIVVCPLSDLEAGVLKSSGRPHFKGVALLA
jgi:hypothetical protein